MAKNISEIRNLAEHNFNCAKLDLIISIASREHNLSFASFDKALRAYRAASRKMSMVGKR
jgi:hypothetical protein